MLHAETFISGNSAILAATPSFDGLRSALKTIFFIFAHPNEIHEPSDQIGTFSTVSTQPGANKEVGPLTNRNKRNRNAIGQRLGTDQALEPPSIGYLVEALGEGYLSCGAIVLIRST